MPSPLLNIGARALAAAQGSLATVSHNIANANTAGYSRQEAVLSTAAGLYTGAGFFGRGVDLTTVQRQYDRFLTGAVQASTSTAAADKARATGLEQLNTLFADTDNGVGAALDNVFAAAADMANRPGDLSARQVFLSRISQLTSRITAAGSQLAGMQSDADGRIAQDAALVNGRLTEIRQLNERIAQTRAGGQPPNDLLDQRDSAVQALHGLLAVQPLDNGDGTLSLFTVSGQPLLVGNQQAVLQGAPDPANPARTGVLMRVAGTEQFLDQAALGGGSLAGTLQLRDEDLSAAINQLGRIGIAAAAAFNGQQALGVDMNGVAGAALFAVPAPVSVANLGNAGAAAVSASVTGAGALQPSDYEVRWDGTNYSITRLADSTTTTAAALPATVDGLSIAISGSPVAGDRWRVQPFAAAASWLAARAVSPRQVATAFASTVQAGPTNRGSAVASGFAVQRADPANATAVSIVFNSPPTSFNVTGLSGGNLTNVPYTPGQRVPATGDYNGWSVTLDGSPAAGDRFDVTAVTAPAADNRNALAFGGMASARNLGGSSLNEAFASLLADVGARVQSGQAAAQVSAQIQSEAIARQQNTSGVSLDEEAADLLRFQQAYQASAKIIQASQTLFESLLSATR